MFLFQKYFHHFTIYSLYCYILLQFLSPQAIKIILPPILAIYSLYSSPSLDKPSHVCYAFVMPDSSTGQGNSPVLTLNSESLDNIILQKYIELLSEQDPRVRLAAARDLATIRGHFRGKTGSSTPSSPTQINQFVASPEQLQGIVSNLKMLGTSHTTQENFLEESDFS